MSQNHFKSSGENSDEKLSIPHHEQILRWNQKVEIFDGFERMPRLPRSIRVKISGTSGTNNPRLPLSCGGASSRNNGLN